MSSSDPTAAPIAAEAASSYKGLRFFIGGVHRRISKAELEQYLSSFGDFDCLTMQCDASGHSRGYGWAVYRTAPDALIRPEPHVLKGVTLTVEPANKTRPAGGVRPDRNERRDRNEGRAGHSFTYEPRRRRRSRSSSSHSSPSMSSSSSSSSRPRRGGRRRNSFNPPRDAGRLPSIDVGNYRLPSINAAAQAYLQPPSLSAAHPQLPPPLHNNNNNNIHHSQSAAPPGVSGAGGPPVHSAAAPAQETYLCIPLALCPPEFLNDPRTICARLDESRIGSLQIVPPLFAQSNAAPPPSGPPPPPPAAGMPGFSQTKLRQLSSPPAGRGGMLR